jgi:hypothetical protein
MKKHIFLLTLSLLIPSLGHGFVESYTLNDNLFYESHQRELYLERKDFFSISGLYHWGEIINGKVRLGLKHLFGEIGYAQMFDIPIYSYSGDIEDNITSGVYSLGIGFIMDFKGLSLGTRFKLAYSYLVEVSSLRFSADIFGKVDFNNFSYNFSLENPLSLGVSFSLLRDVYFSFVPIVFDNSLVYYWGKLSFLGGFKSTLYQEFDYSPMYSTSKYSLLYPQFDFRIGTTYNFNKSTKMTLINTFKNGNYLNLAMYYETMYNDLSIIAKLSYSYISFIEGGVEVAFRVENLGFLSNF